MLICSIILYSQPYLPVWPNCKLSSSNGEMAGHGFHKRYSSFSAVSSYLLLHHSLRLFFCCVDFFLDDNILCYGKEFEICTTNEILSRRCLIWRKKKNCANSDLPFLTFLLILDEWKPTMHKNDSRDISAWLHFALFII